MRLWLLLFLAAALVAALDEVQEPYNGQNMIRYELLASKLSSDGKLADGTIITFYFEHTWDYRTYGSFWSSYDQPVDINFYDSPSVDVDEAFDITAHFRIMKNSQKGPVHINSYVNNGYKEETNFQIELDQEPIQEGRWRVDMYKHDKYNMTVFFQGYFSGTHKFEKPLDYIKSVYIISSYIKHMSMKIPITIPEIRVVSAKDFETEYVNAPPSAWMAYTNVQATFPNGLNIGDRIDMIVVLRAWQWQKLDPSLVFKPKVAGAPSFFLKIVQKWEPIYEGYEEKTHKLYLSSTEDKRGEGPVCYHQTPNGELHHLELERTAKDTVKMTVLYLPHGKNLDDKRTCEHTIPHPHQSYMDKPFDIVSHDGGVLMHLHHHKASQKKKREDL